MLLRDAQIRALVRRAAPIAAPVAIADGTAASQVQPSSLDLRIGGIYVPETRDGDLGSVGNPVSFHDLEPGQTAVLETLEELNFPGDIAAVGFPPDSVSSRGLLMTNPGHVDPGYRGLMKFTVINMGRKVYPLKIGTPVVTLLILRLESPADDDWFSRIRDSGKGATPEMMSYLSRDFLDFRARAKSIAKREIRRARWLTIAEALLATIVVVALAVGPVYIDLHNKVGDQEAEIVRLQEKALADAKALQQQIDSLSIRLEQLDRQP